MARGRLRQCSPGENQVTSADGSNRVTAAVRLGAGGALAMAFTWDVGQLMAGNRMTDVSAPV